MRPDIESLLRLNRELEEVIVQFEDGIRIAVTRSLFDEHPEDSWQCVRKLHDRLVSQERMRTGEK